MTFRIEGWESVVPALPEKCMRYAQLLGEIKSLLSTFKTTKLTAELIARIFEVYVIAKRSAEYNQLLKVKHTSFRGGSMDYLKEK